MQYCENYCCSPFEKIWIKGCSIRKLIKKIIGLDRLGGEKIQIQRYNLALSVKASKNLKITRKKIRLARLWASTDPVLTSFGHVRTTVSFFLEYYVFHFCFLVYQKPVFNEVVMRLCHKGLQKRYVIYNWREKKLWTNSFYMAKRNVSIYFLPILEYYLDTRNDLHM